MSREYRITSQDIIGTAEGDCYLDPSDPLFVETNNLLFKRQETSSEPLVETWEQKYIREHNIKPGTPAWHALRQSK